MKHCRMKKLEVCAHINFISVFALSLACQHDIRQTTELFLGKMRKSYAHIFVGHDGFDFMFNLHLMSEMQIYETAYV